MVGIRGRAESSPELLPPEWGEAIMRALKEHDTDEREHWREEREERRELAARIQQLEQTQSALLLEHLRSARRAGMKGGATVLGAVVAVAGAVTALLNWL